MKNLADHLIFKALRDDDRQALNQLFSHYYRALCHFAHSYLHDPMLAEEVVSDVFFNLWVKRKTLKITGSIKPYLFKAARNQAISYLRYPSFQHDTLEEEIRQDRAQEPDRLLIHRESVQHWQNAIDALPDRCRLVFVLHREEDFTYQEIADLLDISKKTVENQMGKALKSLRERSMKVNQSPC